MINGGGVTSFFIEKDLTLLLGRVFGVKFLNRVDIQRFFSPTLF